METPKYYEAVPVEKELPTQQGNYFTIRENRMTVSFWYGDCFDISEDEREHGNVTHYLRPADQVDAGEFAEWCSRNFNYFPLEKIWRHKIDANRNVTIKTTSELLSIFTASRG